MWFLAQTHEGTNHVQLREMYAKEFCRFCYYYSGNVVGAYWYTNVDFSGVDVTGLRADQVIYTICKNRTYGIIQTIQNMMYPLLLNILSGALGLDSPTVLGIKMCLLLLDLDDFSRTSMNLCSIWGRE